MGEVVQFTVQGPTVKQIVEAALLAAGKPLGIGELLELFAEEERPDRTRIREALEHLEQEYQGRGMELREVASGFRIQVRAEYAPWVSRLWEEKPARYSRALMETLALVAYRQPVTRAEIEDIRGVSVSTNIVKTLLEREWIRVVGHRDVPGRPALYATTREFLDYFGLKSLDELPTLAEIRDLDSINRELDLRQQAAEQEIKLELTKAADDQDPNRTHSDPQAGPSEGS
ncbi:MAG: SMC-Scp complex subunit ScpB [Chromatiales bacterium]|jgi:segregation and condensation protein B